MSRNRSHTFRQRGGYNQRGRGFYRGQGAYVARNQSPPPDPIPHDLGVVIQSVTSGELTPTSLDSTFIRDVKGVASFNWIAGRETPTIAIPGVPPKWSPPNATEQLSEDSGIYYRDINAAQMPQSPLHATALAVLANPDIDTTSVDLQACASTLRSLLLFTRGERRTFRIAARAVGSTVFFLRREGSPREIIPDVRGYGHSMPEVYTEWAPDVRGSVSNQRIVQYKFAGLNCLVRYEPDGYLPDKLPKGFKMPMSSRDSGSDDFDLDAAMRRTAVSNALPGSDKLELKVEKAGTSIPQEATFELKTRTVKRKEENFVAEFAARLWFTQTPYFILAFHDRGRFNDIRISDVRDEVLRWESKNQFDIRKLATLLWMIVRKVRAKNGEMVELWRHESGDLQFLTPRDELYGSLPLAVEDQWLGDMVNGVPL